MARKIRNLKQELRAHGFREQPGRGKGSHSLWKHPAYPRFVTIPGKNSDDAPPYLEKQVRKALEYIRNDSNA